MSYWIFKCNPARFRIDERLADPEPETSWLVTRYRDEIVPGDTAFIWRTGKVGGICAVMSVDTFPQEVGEVPADARHWVDQRENKPQWRVLGRFTHRIPCITRAVLRAVHELVALSVFHGFQQATNFRVSDAEGRVLMRIVEKTR